VSAAARARALADVGRLDQAEQAVRAGLVETPSDPELLSLLAGLRRMQGDNRGALTSADAAVAAGPGRAYTHIERAECLLMLDRVDAGLAAAREAVRLAPDHPEPYRSLARCLTLRKEFGAAREAIGRALAIAPRSVPDLVTLAEVERIAGDRDAARAAASRALAEDPEDIESRWTIAVLDAQRMRVRESMRGLRQLAADHPGRFGAPVLSWPVRGLLDGLTLGMMIGVPLAGLLAVVARWWPASLLLSRGVAGVMVLVAVGMALRVLVPAGWLPWASLGLLPAHTRRAVGVRLVTAGVSVPLLLWYAVSAPGLALALAAAATVVMLAAGGAERR